ncbi:hypothetical protein OG338_00170 [Streptomyces sp. NBC_00726]|uniref:hypothetical protein n=1 Tax=Streptomyces sp. NBC_00726 TaxID=2903674 RepID=UPI003868E653
MSTRTQAKLPVAWPPAPSASAARPGVALATAPLGALAFTPPVRRMAPDRRRLTGQRMGRTR